MSNDSPASIYQQLAARGASPVGLVVSLYDTILRDFRRAQAAIASGNIEQRVFEMNHALTVIAHLQSVLDHQRGGPAAKTFQRFYEVTRALTLEASVTCTSESLQKLIQMYSTLRQAWHEIEPRVSAAPPSAPNAAPPPPAKAAPPVASPAQPDSPPTGNWSA